MVDFADLEELKGLSLGQLQQLYRKQLGRKGARSRSAVGPHFRGVQGPRIKSLLVRDLAWHIQQQARDGLDAETQTLLRAAIKQARNNPRTTRKPRLQGQGTSSDLSKLRSRKKSSWAKPQLRTGTKLVRTWRGKTYEVQVVQDRNGRKRYRLGDQEYRSLTVIAQQITGAHWSGPRFFGLHRVRSIR